MFNAKFVLRSSVDAEKSTSIQFLFYHDKQRFKYSLGPKMVIAPELWNKQTMRPISTKLRDCNDDKTIQSRHKRLIQKWKHEDPNIQHSLDNIHNRIENLISQTTKFFGYQEQKQKKVDFDDLKEFLNDSYGNVKKTPKKPTQENLNDFINRYIKEIQNGTRTYLTHRDEIKRYGTGTIKVYRLWQNQWNDFQKTKKRVYRFDDITIDFYKEYTTHFAQKKYTTNSIGKQVKVLKAIMRAAQEEGLHNNSQYALKAFKTLHNTTTEIYLTEQELTTMYNLKLKGKPHQELARDVFLVGCYTALRYSDYSRIEPKHIKGNFLHITTQKTRKKVIIPIRPELKKILKKYKNKLPKTYEQKVNKYIKEVGKTAEISDLVHVEKVKGGLTIMKEVPKYEMIKTHTARRTAATLMYKAGIPIVDIMKITGHTTEKNLLNYIRLTEEETAKRLSMNSYFKGAAG